MTANLNRSHALTLVSFFVVSLGTGVGAAKAGQTTMIDVSAEIHKINEEKSQTLRTKYAEQLSDSIETGDRQSITDADIDALARMMSDRDDSVRYWIATSLGYIGPRATRAIPQLEKALRDRACDKASKTSASAIRVAFSRIGVKPPEIPCN
jgi:hypothetical protein